MLQRSPRLSAGQVSARVDVSASGALWRVLFLTVGVEESREASAAPIVEEVELVLAAVLLEAAVQELDGGAQVTSPLLGGPGLRTDHPLRAAQNCQEAARKGEGVVGEIHALVLDAVERVRGEGKRMTMSPSGLRLIV